MSIGISYKDNDIFLCIMSIDNGRLLCYTVSIMEEVPGFFRPPVEVKAMPVSKAQQKAVAKYESKVYDKTLIRMPKGTLARVKAHATERGESVNAFVNRAIAEAMERDGEGGSDHA